MPINVPNINPITSPKFNLLDFIKRQKPITKIIAVVVLIIIIGTGIALGSFIWDPLWNPFRPSPEKVIGKMYQNMKEAKSFHIELIFEIKGSSSSENMTVRLNNDSDKLDPDNIRSKGKIEIVSGDSLSFTLNYVMINKKLFFKVDNIPPIMGMDLSFFQGEWIDVGESSEQEDQETKSLGEFIEEIKEILILKQELKDDKIDSRKVYHYLLGINEEKLKELSQNATDAIVSSVPLIGGTIGSNESIEKQLENIKDFEMNFFIGKRDELLYKISIYDEVGDESGKKSLSLEMNFSDFNKEIDIQVPEGARKIEEILQEMFGGFMGIEIDNIRDSINKLTPMFIR